MNAKFIPPLILMTNVSCTASFLGDAENDCVNFYSMLAQEYARCGFAPKHNPEKYCSCTLYFNQTKSSIATCQNKLQALSCDGIIDSYPKECYASKESCGL